MILYMIKLENITFAYGEKRVVSGLDMNVETGKITCLLGSSGCGKTTILRLIAGLEIPDDGKIFLENDPVSVEGRLMVPPHKRNTGFIFQDLALWPHFTVFKNVAFGLKERKVKNVDEKVEEMLSFFDLTDQVEKYPHQLSGGQKQLVAIARSLVLEPRVLLMDEPLSGLDVKRKRKILEHIAGLKERFNLTIVYVTHDHREAFTIADHIIVMDEGRVEAEGSPEDIKRSDNEFVKWFLEF
jgi:ABC-type Fe3+/spermidine/putrescine transport system ATPase subunit